MLTGRLDMGDYQGKVVVVTGGGSGLGAAMADLFAIQGAKIALLDIDFERAEAKAVMLRQGEHWQPLFCLLPRHLLGALDAAWANGERSPQRLLRQLGARALDCASDDPRLANLNTPDLLKAQASLPD